MIPKKKKNRGKSQHMHELSLPTVIIMGKGSAEVARSISIIRNFALAAADMKVLAPPVYNLIWVIVRIGIGGAEWSTHCPCVFVYR